MFLHGLSFITGQTAAYKRDMPLRNGTCHLETGHNEGMEMPQERKPNAQELHILLIKGGYIILYKGYVVNS